MEGHELSLKKLELERKIEANESKPWSITTLQMLCLVLDRAITAREKGGSADNNEGDEEEEGGNDLEELDGAIGAAVDPANSTTQEILKYIVKVEQVPVAFVCVVVCVLFSKGSPGLCPPA